jgi:hypothetical protein
VTRQEYEPESTECLIVVISRFPELGEAIELRFRNDPVFREVCEDYAQIQKALSSLEGSTPESSDPGADEYRSLLQGLETEMPKTLERGDFLEISRNTERHEMVS